MTNPTVDLTNCDREPIHIPGSIQPHGAMIVCDDAFNVLFASANAAEFLGLAQQPAQGSTLADALGPDAARMVVSVSERSESPSAPGLAFAVAVGAGVDRFDLAVHTFQGRTFVEFERASGDSEAFGPLEFTRVIVRRLAEESSLANLADAAASMTAKMLGYDRVMVYQLLHNGAGRVIAESRREGLGSFLGQHFPASDIPAQARELYKRNWIRMISDVRYTPVPVLPEIRAGDAPLDMSFAQLRSVSPIHCEYLQNMGVDASMSLSIIVDGDLWGLIACHHYSPRAPALSRRIGAEVFAQQFSMQIESIQRRERFDAAQSARSRLDRIVFDLPPDRDLAASLAPRIEDLRLLVPSDGAALWIEGQWASAGASPDHAQVLDLIAHIDSVAAGEVWSSNQLAAIIPGFASSDIAGVLAVPVSRQPRDYLFYFRREEGSQLEWAGEPVKAVGKLGDRLTPRKSFETWREDVRGQSLPWTSADHAIADTVQNYLRDVVLRHSEATAEERKRADIRRRLVNEELNHRVKNVLALTKAIVQQSRRRAESVDAMAETIHGRLRALAYAHDQITQDKGVGELRRLIESELEAYGGTGGGKASAEGPAVRLAGKSYSSLAMVAHELTTNAAKYGGLSAAGGRVDVRWRIDSNGDLLLDWVESGGPQVQAPKRTGFGSTLIGQVVPFDLDGEAKIEFPPDGVRASFRVPARHIVVDGAIAPAPTDVPGPRVNLAGKRVLLVDDQVLIALDAEHCLRQLGAAQIIIAPTIEQALKSLAADAPDLAVLDVNLGDMTSLRLAEALRAASVPFVFATGYGDSILIPDGFKQTPIVRKPYGEETLGKAIADALANPAESQARASET